MTSQPAPLFAGLAGEALTFGYAAGQLVLDAVTVALPQGHIIGILGPNGSGKTTLLRLLAGMRAPLRGRVMLDAEDVRALGRAALARRMAVVPQETHLAFDYTVLEMAMMGRYPHLGPFEVEGPADLERAREALRATGTLGLQGRPFNELSGGEKQRVVIASALAQLSSAADGPPQRTEVLLLDEPTASLDLAYQLEIRSILTRLNRDRGLTIVVSTHDLNFAAGLCGELILLHQGRVLASGATEEVMTTALIRTLYAVDVDVTRHERAGHLTVVPVARSDSRPQP